jgi:uncharacterized protein YcsI (UPF0317 family)
VNQKDKIVFNDMSNNMDAKTLREKIRNGEFKEVTSGQCKGFQQAK